MMAAVLRVILVATVVVAILLALLWVFQRRLIYLPDTAAVPAAESVLPSGRDVTLATSDGLELGAWHVAATGPSRGATVLVANGNGGNRAGRAPLARELAAAGFDVLLFDYRGYGGNPGRPSSDGLSRDASAAYDYLVDEAGVTPDRLLYFGESLGGAVLAGLATERPPAGLLLRSPFTSLADIGRHHYPIVPVGLLLWDEFPVAEQVSDVAAPTTIVYGTADSIVPPAQSRAVADAAAGLIEVVEIRDAGHNDAEMFTGAELVAAVERLADEAIGPAAD